MSLTTFTLTFTLEVLESGIWEDHKEGLIELERSIQTLKFGYTLYLNQMFGVDVEIWPQAARITSGERFCWVRTWQYLERRWLSFSIKHEIPVQVRNMIQSTARVTYSVGYGNTLGAAIVFTPLPFGVSRYFGPVKEYETLLELSAVIKEWLWALLEQYIPNMNDPHPVTDKRHQDTLVYIVQDLTLNPIQKEEESEADRKARLSTTKPKQSSKKTAEIVLAGDSILAGVGRVIPFEIIGDFPDGVGQMVILLSSSNLPSSDDDPIVFINVDNLFDAPLIDFQKLGITDLYTRWNLGEEVHDSKQVQVTPGTEINFKDHHAVPLEPLKVNEITAAFLDSYFSVELRGIRSPVQPIMEPQLFGYDKADRDYDLKPVKLPKQHPTDFIIAITKIDARSLSKGLNAFTNGEYPLFPPRLSVCSHDRAKKCANDVNLIGQPFTPEVVVPASLVLAMSLEVSIGVVGCKPPRLTPCFSRLYCLISDTLGAMAMLAEVRTINERIALIDPEAMLTGFAVDTGDVVVLFLEGPRDGNILKVWELSEEFYPKVKPVFNSSSRYSKRVYEEFLKELAPFIVLKTHMPLEVLLACPATYVRPALPNPARIAALKFGRLIQCRFRSMPPRAELPTVDELRSFRLELCAPLRSFSTPAPDKPCSVTPMSVALPETEHKVDPLSTPSNRINWEIKE